MSDLAFYRSRVKINKHAIDDEVVEQSELMYNVSLRCAQAQAIRDEAYAKSKSAISDAKNILRQHYEAHNASVPENQKIKITEGRLDAEAPVHPTVKLAYEKYLQTLAEANEWSALKEAYQQRSFMLAHVVELTVIRFVAKDAVTETDIRNKINTVRRRLNEQSGG